MMVKLVGRHHRTYYQYELTLGSEENLNFEELNYCFMSRLVTSVGGDDCQVIQR